MSDESQTPPARRFAIREVVGAAALVAAIVAVVVLALLLVGSQGALGDTKRKLSDRAEEVHQIQADLSNAKSEAQTSSEQRDQCKSAANSYLAALKDTLDAEKARADASDPSNKAPLVSSATANLEVQNATQEYLAAQRAGCN